MVADRQVEVEYVFDRLGDAALAQAYRLLVPERRRVREGLKDGDCSDLRQSILREAEAGADDNEPDNCVEGVCGNLGL